MSRRNTAGKKSISHPKKFKIEIDIENKLESIRKLSDIGDKSYLVEQLAEILGISKWGVLKRIERGQLKAKKNGRRWYIKKSVLMRILSPD